MQNKTKIIEKNVEIAIIGAGSAGLSARKIVAQKTSSYVVIDSGPLGTTCARVGCMPSKVFIQTAKDFYKRRFFSEEGILGADSLRVESQKIMSYVRQKRDRFVRSVLSGHESWKEEHLLMGRAHFKSPYTIEVFSSHFHTEITAKKIIIATGSSPFFPEKFLPFRKFFMDTNEFFEQEELPKKMIVWGLGVIGLELGLAAKMLGIECLGINRSRRLALVSDPELKSYLWEKISQKMPLLQGTIEKIETVKDKVEKIKVWVKQIDPTTSQELLQEYETEKILLAIGRTPNLTQLGLENLPLLKYRQSNTGSTSMIPLYDSSTMQCAGYEHLFIAGDSNGDKTILHEASDEGIIAGINATLTLGSVTKFKRKAPLSIVFTNPQLAYVGKKYEELEEEKIPFVIGKASFEGQGRSIVENEEEGKLHLYCALKTGQLLGAEIYGPQAEHLGHLFSWAIQDQKTVEELLLYPFYHPVIEEGARTALRHALSLLYPEKTSLELLQKEIAPLLS